MKEIKNQRGFSTLEIILVVSIIGIFAGVAVPKMARTVDKVCLDYEMKHLYSDLNFARDLSRSVGYNPSILSDGNYTRDYVKCWLLASTNKVTVSNTRQNEGKPNNILRQYKLSNGITFNHINGTANLKEFTFNEKYSFKESYTIQLNSKFSGSAYIRLDTVGRIRGTRNL